MNEAIYTINKTPMLKVTLYQLNCYQIENKLPLFVKKLHHLVVTKSAPDFSRFASYSEELMNLKASHFLF